MEAVLPREVRRTNTGRMARESMSARPSADPPTVLATDRASYKEVTDAMRARGLDEVLKTVPKLPADASVTLCLLDARAIPAAHATRVTMAVSGGSDWVADGDFN